MIDRRRLLKALGYGTASSLMLPFLDQIVSAQEGNGSPKRFLFVVEGNGFEPVTMLSDAARAALNPTLTSPLTDERWWHRKYAHNAPAIVAGDLTTAPALAGLGDLAASSIVLFGLSSKITGGGHSAFHGVLSSTRTTGGAPSGQTIDAWLAEQAQVREQTPYSAIRLGVGSEPERPLEFGTCAYGVGRAAPLMLKPQQAYQALFGSIATAEGMAAFSRRGSQLEFAIQDVDATLRRFGGGSRERQKLDIYRASLEARLQQRARLVELENQLRASNPSAPGEAGEPLDRFRQQLDLAASALIGGLTNVSVVCCGTGNDFDLTYRGIINGVSRHNLHHQSAENAQFREAIHMVTTQQVSAIAEVARRLQSTPDVGGGSMLENTVIVYIGDNGEQHHSTASDFPILMIGGQRLGLRTQGRTIIYPGLSSDGHRQLSNVWNTLGHLGGVPLNNFGKEERTRRALGPLNELLA